MAALLLSILDALDLRQPAVDIKLKLADRIRVAARRLSRTDDQLIKAYFQQSETPKLQIGTGKNALVGWLNTDYAPLPGSAFLDATRQFPFADASFAFIYSEHMIEHVPYPAGLAMLKECYRVLKPGGVIRIATPDLAFLATLHRDPQKAQHLRYIQFATDRHIGDAPRYLPAFVINNFVRAWGHQFIYDEAALELALETAGFEAIRRCRILESDHPELANLENVARMPEGFVALESLILEASKPG
jgi:predicted SAM-dependent methyltransferase